MQNEKFIPNIKKKMLPKMLPLFGAKALFCPKFIMILCQNTNWYG